MKRYIGLFVSLLLTLTMSAQSHVVLADSVQGDSTIHRPHKAQRQSFAPSDIMGCYTPQSPQTAAFLKYTEFPVSPATGIPNIDIPIYTIELDGVSVPISISYHASGIKVSDVASPVGLGWTLNAGGVIGCGTNGVRDDYASQAIKSASDFKEKLTSGTLSPTALRYIASGVGSIDTESDRYLYNFNGHCGCLRYDYTDMTLRPIPYEPVKFETLASGGFKATDGYGTQYFFTLTEFVSMTGYSHRSACYLTSIVTPTQCDTISFTYGKTSVYYQTLASEYQHSGTYYDWDEENVGSGIPYVPVEGPVSEYAINKDNINYATPLITSISWKGNSVVFSYSSDRPEYKLQRERLTQIQVKDYMGNAVNRVSLDNSASLGGTDRTDYLDGSRLVLHNGKPAMFLYEGGYCSVSASNSFDFHYYNTDHLGNVRELVGSNGAVEQVTHYYPFGNVFCDGSSTNYDVQPYKYNGKELDLIHGLNSYDYGARQLTMDIPRWDRVDPLAENTPAESPYAYCGNNPINFFDSDGQSGLSKFAKVVAKISAKVIKKGPAALKQTATYADAFSDVIDNVNSTFGSVYF